MNNIDRMRVIDVKEITAVDKRIDISGIVDNSEGKIFSIYIHDSEIMNKQGNRYYSGSLFERRIDAEKFLDTFRDIPANNFLDCCYSVLIDFFSDQFIE